MAVPGPTLAVDRLITSPRLSTAIRWTLVAVYAWSAGGKLFWPARFRRILSETGMLPPELLTPLAYGVPAAELLLALALAAKLLLPLALLASLFLSTLFAGIHGYLILVGELVPCGCSGIAIEFSSRNWHVFLLVLSLAMGVGSAGLLFAGRQPRAESQAVPASRAQTTPR